MISYLTVSFSIRFFNDQELKNTEILVLRTYCKQNTHTLTLPKAELTDEGIYKCIATNPVGTIETKAHISVCSMFLKLRFPYFSSFFSFSETKSRRESQ